MVLLDLNHTQPEEETSSYLSKKKSSYLNKKEKVKMHVSFSKFHVLRHSLAVLLIKPCIKLKVM
jgi:hypothetical protein